MLKLRKFCLDKITKIKKLLTFKKKKVSVEETARSSVTYAEFLKLKNKRVRAKAISKSEFQLRLNNILEEYEVGITRWFKVADLFFIHPMSYVDRKYTQSKKPSTKKSIFRKKDGKVLVPVVTEHVEPEEKHSDKQQKIQNFIEEMYDEQMREHHHFSKKAADDMMASTRKVELEFVAKWRKYLERTKHEPDVESFEKFLKNNQKFTNAQIKKIRVAAVFHGQDLINFAEFKEELERVKDTY